MMGRKGASTWAAILGVATLWLGTPASAGFGDFVNDMKDAVGQVTDTSKDLRDAVGEVGATKETIGGTVEEGKALLPESTWYKRSGEQKVRLTGEELGDQILDGKIGRSTQVWRKGMDAWAPAGEVSELASWFAQVPPDDAPVTDDEPPPFDD